MMKSLVLLAGLALLELHLVASQGEDSLVLGKECPDLQLRNIEGWAASSLQVSSLRGKWVILDFWNCNCTSCIRGFPGTSRMAQKYAGKVQWIMVAQQDRNDQVHKIWRKAIEQENLAMPCAFDSALVNSLGFHAAPRLLVIDDKGILRGDVPGIHDSQLDSLLAGTKQFIRYVQAATMNFKMPMLLFGNGGADDDYQYRAIFARWSRAQGAFKPGTILYAVGKHLFQTMATSAAEMYDLAYFGRSFQSPWDTTCGKISLKPVFEVADQSKVIPDTRNEINFYSFSLALPEDTLTAAHIKRSMQHTLEDYFGFTAAIEERMTPYYALVSLAESAKDSLRTKGGKMGITGSPVAKYRLQNTPVKAFLSILAECFGQSEIYLDETGINGNIDITMDALLTRKDLYLQELHRNGLDLVLKAKPMKVVVVKEP